MTRIVWQTLRLCLGVMACSMTSLMAADLPKPTGEQIVSPDARIETLFTRSLPINGGLTEGPAVGPDGCIYFSDIPSGKDEGKIMKYDPQSKQTTVFAANSYKSNGLKFDAHGTLYACEGADDGGRGIAKYDIKTGKRTVVVNKYKGKLFNAPNDLVIDQRGRIFFSDPKYVGPESREQPHRSVYRIDTDGTVTEVTHDVEKPNGVGLSLDGKILYVADHNNGVDRIGIDPPGERGAMKIYAFPLNEDGSVGGPRKTLYDFGTAAGCDGMTIDSSGNLYLTSRSPKRPGILVLNPDGAEIAFIPTGVPQPEDTQNPVGLPSNVTFGSGSESNVLYITIDLGLARIPTKSQAFQRFAQ